LAGIGFDVEGVDISREATDMALQAARKAGVDLKATVCDLEEDYQFETRAYDLIVCFNYLHRPLIPKMKEALRSRGMVVYETYIVDQARFGRPRNPDHLLKHNELLDLFRGFRCLRYHEGLKTPRRAVAGIIAQKP
jgi:2-polyprenyl-3-methyl-5-hydroxy-6-metoxy-1,4-benzoquinol methylase